MKKKPTPKPRRKFSVIKSMLDQYEHDKRLPDAQMPESITDAGEIAVTQSTAQDERGTIPLYHHKTTGGAEYLTDRFVAWEHEGKKGKEGIFEGAKYIVRIDGDITKDAELTIADAPAPAVKRPRSFPFLVTAELHEGEYERTDNCLLRARDMASAQKQAAKLFDQRHGMDTRKAYFGHGDGLTASELQNIEQITEAEAETLTRLNLVHYA